MRCCANGLCRMPPAPRVLAGLRQDYKNSGVAGKITFVEYLQLIGFVDRSTDINGMDDSILLRAGESGPELFNIPHFKVTGKLEVMVLLVDFPDVAGTRPKAEYEALLFGKGNGSMADYFAEVSCKKVELAGSVHGWLRMPQPSAVYTSGESGMNPSGYPDNAQGMAEHAVKEALRQGVKFEPSLDKLKQGVVTALFIVHAGPGAEVLPRHLQGSAFWSLKWILPVPVPVANGLSAAAFLTVPENCDLGVCAHELGHLAFQWEDFYDANYDEDGDFWDGSGDWDLMASGSYNGDGGTPARPAGLHRIQHGWIPSRKITAAQGRMQTVSIGADEAILVVSQEYKPGQYLLLENRQQSGFDAALPGHGLLIWRVDERQVNTTSKEPGLFLLEADANSSWQPGDHNQGDPGDPFPGSSGALRISDTGPINTSFPNGTRSGVQIDGIGEADGRVTCQVRFTSL